MLALDNQSIGSNVSPSEFNQLPSEIQNTIEDTQQTLDTTILEQLGRAISDYVMRGIFYTGGGTAAAQTLATIGSMESPPAYRHGMRVKWRPSNASVGGGTTIDVNSLGVKTLEQEDATAIIANDLITTKDAEARYDSGADVFFLIGA